MPSPQIIQAIARAKEAVEADNRGDFTTAIALYKEAVSLIELQIPHESQEHREILVTYARSYQTRISTLEAQKAPEPQIPAAPTPPSQPIRVFQAPEFQIEWHENPITVKPPTDKPPSSMLHRPFWLMNRLAVTMVAGGYLTSTLYVPRDMWYQSGAKFHGIAPKIQCCEALIETVHVLSHANVNSVDMIKRELDSFYLVIRGLQNNLAHYFSFIKEFSDEKRDSGGLMSRVKNIGHSIAKGASQLGSMAMKTKIEDDSAYIQLLVNTFKSSAFLEAWIVHYEMTGNQEILARLERITHFYWSVLCAFVMNDLSMLLDRYMRKCRESFTLLFPD